MKDLKQKNIIVIVAIIILILFIGIFIIITQSNKPILYRYNIEDIDYMATNPGTKIYKVEYNTKPSGILTHVSVQLFLNDDGSCSDSSSYENETGYTSVQVESNCKYILDGDKVSIKIDSMKQIYVPSSSFRRLGYKEDTSYEYNISFDGEFSEKGKFLTIGNLPYKESGYLIFLEKGINYILVNPTDNKLYKLDGTPAFNSDSEYVSKNSLNLSNYKIIDGE